MNPEFQLLTCCSSSQPDPRSVRDLLSKEVNWQLLLNLAAQHRLRPILLKALKVLCWESVPQAIQRELALFCKANAERNLRFTGELLQLFGVFQEQGIVAATVKGPVLASSVYGDISLREFCDLDVIVREADLAKAEEILIGRGYKAQFPDRAYRSAFLRYQGQYAFGNATSGISVDLHWQLASRGVVFPLRMSELWSRLENLSIGGKAIATLPPDDLALFLAAHGTKEGWRSLNWVCDFAKLLSQCKSIDWLVVFDRAQRSHSTRSLLLAVTLASELLDAPVPQALIDRGLKNPAVQALAEEAKARMLRAVPEAEHEEFRKGLNTHDRLRHRLWPVATLLTTRTVGDYEAMPLPESLWGVYYVTRPFRLAIKFLTSLLPFKRSQVG